MKEKLTQKDVEKIQQEIDHRKLVVRKEAIEAVSKANARGKKYDAVLMDIMMPVMNGYEATKAIRQMEKEKGDDSHVPIIAMTANAFVEDAARCREAGMDAHVAKPLDINCIITVIDRYTR